ncbi:hypothetical protein KC363_g6089 [Hortaea werneckii]|uniref:RNase MRP protein 1 RNA binding domain-containing protein n=1 Tax=Hortaea werneckii TaxID=91943 RepID=A0A3M7FM19_HORWE|nr:hypothetical protein KC325_g6130 [Hortaea werneckii]KAI6990394.1 hypothetical protein KC359_g6685 [Hortaea werneckii]KAI7171276.1 hypothetical protein KC360_g6212 [Hortaea werneckii]KAI7187258.1 hypothetical protein KC363_g6089 [Hortaea werneckii]RMY89832.1 hypothetical protein D0861_04015 [Hortaea werneckii]
MSFERPARISKESEESVERLANLLHLFHHRNKNQHRRSIWWRSFQIFRRQINAYLTDVKLLNQTPTTHLERTKKKAKDPQTILAISRRVDCWQDFKVPRWQRSFSQVVADGRFSMLGLTLIAVLSEVCRIARITTAYEEAGQAEVEKALEKFAEEGWEGHDIEAAEPRFGKEDLGEAISRDQMDEAEDRSLPTTNAKIRALQPSPEPQKSSAPAAKPASKRGTPDTSRPMKKKRKKGNAIDDLFSGLG